MKGGSYLVPIRGAERPPPEYELRIITAHGQITPEFYYIVPENTIIILPNACGTVLAAERTATDYLFMPPDTARTAFERDFMSEAGSLRSPFTAYFPGDIMPLHMFTFSPLLRIYTDMFLMGFVGVYAAGAFYGKAFVEPLQPPAPPFNPLTGAVPLRPLPTQNLFELRPATAKAVVAELLRYLAAGPSKDAAPEVRSRWGANRAHVGHIVDAVVTDLLGDKEDARRVGFRPSFNAGKTDHYRPGLAAPRWAQIFAILQPCIPDNEISPLIVSRPPSAGASLTESRDWRRFQCFLPQIVGSATSAKPQIFLVNTCRSLKEKGERDWDQEEGAKPSMALIRAVSNATRGGDVNIRPINEVRQKAGLPAVVAQVLGYAELRRILQETVPLLSAESAALREGIEGILKELRDYAPPTGKRLPASVRAEEWLAGAPAAGAGAPAAGAGAPAAGAGTALKAEANALRREIARLRTSTTTGTAIQRAEAKAALAAAQARRKIIIQHLGEA